jgi:hypothetical protein
MPHLFSLYFCILFCTEAAYSDVHVPTDIPLIGQLPDEWYELPENVNYLQSLRRKKIPEETLFDTVERIYDSTARGVDKIPDREYSVPVTDALRHSRPADWTPWHLEAFATDLSVTLSGLLGILTVRGTPSISAYWRQHSVVPLPPRPIHLTSNVDEDTPAMSDQIEAAVQAAVATGQVRNGPALRKNLLSATEQFQEILGSIEQNANPTWWLSTFQFYFTVDASGQVYPPFSVGGGLRMRFVWRRLKRLSPVPYRMAKYHEQNIRALKFATSLKELVALMESGLSDMSYHYLRDTGFEPEAFGAGIAVTVNGAVGLASGSLGLSGSIGFSKDALIPIRPATESSRSLATAFSSPVLLVENNPSAAHLEYAKSYEIEHHIYADQGVNRQALYRVKLDRFRKGLAKAFKIGAFFAKPALKQNNKKWKVHQLVLSFDLSISGDVGLVGINGTGTIYAYLVNTRI